MSAGDVQLLSRWHDHGDGEAFRELSARYAGMVYGTCVRILGEGPEAEEAAKACLNALASRPAKRRGLLGAWLHAEATARSLNLAKGGPARPAAAAALGDAGWERVSPAVDEAIAGLPGQLREPFVGHFLDGLPHMDIAQALGISRHTVTTRIAKGLEGVRKALKERGVNVSEDALKALMMANMSEAVLVPASLNSAIEDLVMTGPVKDGQAQVIREGPRPRVRVAAATLVILAVAVAVVVWSTLKTSEAPGPGVQPPPPHTSPVPEAEGPMPDRSERPTVEAHSIFPDAGTLRPQVTGVVLDGTGERAGGAQVEGRAGGHREEAKSDSAGRFVLGGFTAGETVQVDASLTANRTQPMKSFRLELRPLPAEGIHGVQLVLHRLGGLNGTVMDLTGEVLGGVRVVAFPLRYAVPPPKGFPLTGDSAVSGGDGAFRIAGLFAGTYQVGFEDTGMQRVVKVLEGAAVEGVELVYTGTPPLDAPPAGSQVIAGTVYGPDGAPLGGALVHAQSESSESPFSHGEANTNEQGAYLIEGLAEVPHVVKVRHSAFVTAHRTGVAGGSRDVDFRLEKRNSVEGRVVDGTTGEPVEDFTVGHHGDLDRLPLLEPEMPQVLYHERQVMDFRKVHDAAGEFLIGNVSPGPCWVVVRAEGYSPQVAELQVPSIAQGVAEVEVALFPEALIEGLVVDSQGAPVEGAFVFMHGFAGNGRGADQLVKLASAQSDESGGFLLREVPLEPFTLSVYHRGYLPVAEAVRPMAGESRRVAVVLEAEAMLRGTVTVDGGPVAGVRVRVDREDETQAHTETDAEGHYGFASLRAGEVKVVAVLEMPATAPNSVSKPRLVERETVLEAGSLTEVDIDFAPLTASLEGHVILDGHVPKQSGVRLDLVTPEGEEEHLEATPDGEGTFGFEDLPPGEATIRAWAVNDGERRTTQRILMVEEGHALYVAIDFTGGGVVEGQVAGFGEKDRLMVYVFADRDTAPEKIEEMVATVKGLSANAYACTRPAKDGFFHVAGFEPGDYTVVAIVTPPEVKNLATPEERRAIIRRGVGHVTVEEGEVSGVVVGTE